jgi:hypothetical protein
MNSTTLPNVTETVSSNNETIKNILEKIQNSESIISDINDKIRIHSEFRQQQSISFQTLADAVNRLKKLPFVDPSVLASVNDKVRELDGQLQGIQSSVNTRDVDNELLAQITSLTTKVNEAISANIADPSTTIGGRKKRITKSKKRHIKKGGYTYKKSPTRKLLSKRRHKRQHKRK